MESEILISVKALSRFYGQQRAIEDVSFDVHRGEILGFLGPNGAGKSTTMQIISGIVAATHGSVSVAGHDINETPRQAKQHIGFLPEQPPLYNDLTVDEYLYYSGRLRGIAEDKLDEAVQVSKQRCALDQTGERLINNLSKGYKQRVGIAQAIIHSPSVIILDEPTSGLDPIQIREIRALMRELAQDHSVILSTHILSEVQSLCDRVLIINEGRIVLDQPLNKLHEHQDKPESIVIGLRQPPALDDLLGIDGIASAESISSNILRINFTADTDATDAIVSMAAEKNWGLYQLNADDASLETLFMRLTYGAEQAEPEAQAE
ncbi:MAG: ATP-binding cassette domain-containing protein [Gammaproteobacteria bacterium]|nr:ATP-binding cassette domain-containing protein [Gammaproteobacteria bacterium]